MSKNTTTQACTIWKYGKHKGTITIGRTPVHGDIRHGMHTACCLTSYEEDAHSVYRPESPTMYDVQCVCWCCTLDLLPCIWYIHNYMGASIG